MASTLAPLQSLQVIDRSSFSDDDSARLAVLSEAQRLCQRLETPEETIMRMTFQEPTLNLALRIADELQLFSHLGPAGSPPVSVAALARPTGADPDLVKRVLRHCAAKGVVAEHDGDAYAATSLTALLSTRQGSAPLRCVAHKYNPIFEHVPAYLRSTGFRVPRDARDGPFQASALGKAGQTHFEWLETPGARPVAEDFNLLMQFGARSEASDGRGQRGWTDALDTGVLLAGDLDATVPLMVDVGGNLGHNSGALRRVHPDKTGRVVVQDLAPVIEQALSAEGKPADVEFTPHDFFAPQPLAGAKLYFLGHVLHDWPDVEARKILANTAAAMTKGYSVLVLREKVLPGTGCDPHLSAIDIIMMAELAAHERSDAQWADLLGSEGLKLKSVNRIPSSQDSILLAELA